MAQTGFTPLLIYSSSTATNAPTAGDLLNNATGSELAINIADGKLFYKDSGGSVQVIGWKIRPATAGGTGLTSFAVGDLIYADTTTTLAKLADVATGNALISGGVGVAPSYGKIGLTTHVSGTLPVANGGTGLTSLTSGYIPFGTGTTAFGNSANLFWDSTNSRLGLGTTSPREALDVTGNLVLAWPGTSAFMGVQYGAGQYQNGIVGVPGSRETRVLAKAGDNSGIITFYTGAGTSESARIFSSGGVSIGNTTDPGATNLSVSGTTNTATGSVSATTGVATTIYTMPTLGVGLYIVQAALFNQAPATFTAVSIITQGNGTSRATAIAVATSMSISVSGLNIQATQLSGGTNPITWTVFRIA